MLRHNLPGRVGDIPVHRHRRINPARPAARAGISAGADRTPPHRSARAVRAAVAFHSSPRVTRSSSSFSDAASARSPRACPRSSPWPTTPGRLPQARPSVRMGLHSGLARAGRRRVHEPGGAPRGPGRRGRPRRAGAVLRGDRRSRPDRSTVTRGCSTSACTGCAASTTVSGSTRWSRIGWSGSSRIRARWPASPHNLPSVGHVVRRPRRRARRRSSTCSTATDWSTWSVRAARARPGSRSKWPATWSRGIPTACGSPTSPR